jgi:hypothetical protein
MIRSVPIAIAILIIPMIIRAQDAREIVEKMDKKWRGEYVTQEMSMTIVRPSWERSISMKTWGRGQEYSLVYIIAPAKEKGQVFMKRRK